MELKDRHLTPRELREIVTEKARDSDSWAADIRFDLTERHYRRLHRDDDVEVWLICWDIGQDTLLHDHGGSVGAFTVVSGSLFEDFGAVGRTGLRTRRHAAGDTVSFGADYLHNLVNVGTEPAVSIHAYSPPLSTMNFYCWLPTGMHHLRELACDSPEPETTALETAAATLRELACDSPEPETTALEAAAATLRELACDSPEPETTALEAAAATLREAVR